MALFLYSLVALMPLATVFLLLLVARRPAGQVMPGAYLVTVGIAVLVWRVPAVQVAAASIQGLVAAAEILCPPLGPWATPLGAVGNPHYDWC
ncbi:MAG: L-lactate permease [Leptolyngbyaceae cyanobacterium]